MNLSYDDDSLHFIIVYTWGIMVNFSIFTTEKAALSDWVRRTQVNADQGERPHMLLVS